MKILKSLLILTITVITFSCSRDDDNSSNNGNDNSTGITITTTSVSEIGLNTAKSGGQITNDGGNAVTSRGIVWDINPNPTISLSTKTTDGIGTGVFNSSLENLEGGKTYYVRAFATNNKGTAYGNEIIFYLPKIFTLVNSINYSNSSGAIRIFENASLNNVFYAGIGSINVPTEGRRILIDNNDKYVTGNIGSYFAKIWKSGVLTQLSNNPDSSTFSTFIKNNDVYVVGKDRAGVNNFFSPVFWKNGVKNELTVGGYNLSTYETGYAIDVFIKNSDTYIIGYTYPDNNSNYYLPTLWKNGTKIILSNVANNNKVLKKIFVDDSNNVYVLSKNSYWKNNIEYPLQNIEVEDILVKNNDLYIVGNNTIINGGALLWKNGNISSLDNGIYAKSIKFLNNDIYIVGSSLVNNIRTATIWINNKPYYLYDNQINQVTDGIDISIN